MCDEGRGRGRGCRCGSHVRGFIQPRLLLLLAKKAAYGYELMDVLRSVQGDENLADPGILYRTLRQFEQNGLVTSAWDTDGHGPARRVYQLTEAGCEYLEWWVTDIRKTRAQLDRFLAEYESVVADRSPSPYGESEDNHVLQ